MARTHDVEHVALVEVGTTFIIEQQGCIWTFAEPLGIVGVAQSQHADIVFGDKLHLGSSPVQGIVPIFHRLAQTGGSVRDYVVNIVAMVIDIFATTQRLVELQGYLLVETHHAG